MTVKSGFKVVHYIGRQPQNRIRRPSSVVSAFQYVLFQRIEGKGIFGNNKQTINFNLFQKTLDEDGQEREYLYFSLHFSVAANEEGSPMTREEAT